MARASHAPPPPPPLPLDVHGCGHVIAPLQIHPCACSVVNGHVKKYLRNNYSECDVNLSFHPQDDAFFERRKEKLEARVTQLHQALTALATGATKPHSNQPPQFSLCDLIMIPLLQLLRPVLKQHPLLDLNENHQHLLQVSMIHH